ncbi:hypothetical protein C8R43DRAFT_1040202 [Mycena crocata]|nr:hypothetical protein C8R43DRAFT_1040202 [Mycena crocata]
MSMHLCLLFVTSSPIVAECGFRFRRFCGGLRRDAVQQTVVGWLWRVRAADDRYVAVRERRGRGCSQLRSSAYARVSKSVYETKETCTGSRSIGTVSTRTLHCSGDGSRADSARIAFPGLIESVVAPGCQPRLGETCSLECVVCVWIYSEPKVAGRDRASASGGGTMAGEHGESGQAARWW